MGKSAFNKEIWRSITHSLGRFIAIFAIVALGVGFYAGLRMTAPDMQLAADAFYDETHLMDVRVVSTMGMTADDAQALAQVEGVEGVMAAYEADAVGMLADEPYVFRVHSLNQAALNAEGGDNDDDDGAGASGAAADAGDAGAAADEQALETSVDQYLNRLDLVEGRMPTAPGECVISVDRIMNAPVGVGDVITLTEGTTDDLADVFAATEYTIVGMAHSSYYTASTPMGVSTLGSGSVQQFMYVTEGCFAEDYPFTEVFLTVKGARGLASSSVAYDDAVAAVVERVNAIAPEREQARLDGLRADAQAKLDDARAEYEAERADAEAELADAKRKLDDAAADISRGQRDVISGQSDLDDAKATLEEERADAESQIADARGQIREKERELWSSKAELSSKADELAAAESQLEKTQAGLVSKQTELQGQLAQVEGALSDPRLPDEQRAQLEMQKQQLDAGIEQVESGLAQTTAGLEQVQAGKAQLAAAERQIEDGERQISDAYDELEAKEAEANEKLNDAQVQIDDAEAELASGRADLAQGRRDYASGLADYEAARADADAQFADAEAELADAQAEIDAIERPSWLVMDRSKNIGAESFAQDAVRIDHIAAVFPFIFFLVAALVALTTMTRMVDEERMVIGTYKALGYSRTRISSKYLVYAGAASVAGSIVGIAALAFTLPAVIMMAYSIVYIVPISGLAIDWPIALTAAGLGVGITLLATWGACMSTLRESPAALMLPRAPKAGKRILLERIAPLWRRMSFLWKVTARNIFRYKKRFIMTVVGIAGCTALLLTGFGLQDSINDIIDKHFGQLVRYTVIVTEDDDAPPETRAEVQTVLADEGQSQAACEAQEMPLVAVGVVPAESAGDAGTGSGDADAGAGGGAVGDADAGAESGGDQELSVSLIVPQDAQAFAEMWTLRDRQTGQTLALEDGSCIVTEKIATRLGLALGDRVVLAEQDDMGNPTADRHAVRVSGIAENYVGHNVFMTPATYEETFGEASDARTIFAIVTEDAGQRDAFAEAMRAVPGVKTVAFNDETIDSYKSALSSVNMVVVVLILAAAALAFIVLYNLTNINIAERVREIATLKVLGFLPAEVRRYIFRETIILSIIGAIVGLALGIVLEDFVVVTAEVDQVMFGREIHPLSFVLSFALTMVFTVVVMLVMNRKLANVNMVESLKSNE